MKFQGYTADPITFDNHQGPFHGEVAVLRDIVTRQGRAAHELQQAFRVSIDDHLAFCAVLERR